MKKSIKNYGLMALATALCAIGMQACWIGDSDCYTRTQCTRVCDWWECWDDCTEQYLCEDDYYYNPGGESSYQCRENRDCSQNSYCQNGKCYQYNSGDTPFCGNCSITDDCIEGGAVCVGMDDGTQTCMRACDYDTDCPNGFECLAMEGKTANGSRVSSKQCYPTNGSCDANFCKDSRDCVQNAECVNNVCVVPTTNLNECNRHSDCDGYGIYNTCYKNSDGESYCAATCYTDEQCDIGYNCYLTKSKSSSMRSNPLDSGICLTVKDGSCIFSADCGDGMVCNNGKCAVTCKSDRDCTTSTDFKFYCEGGICVP